MALIYQTIFLFFIFWLTAQAAQAYIDPGSGSFIFQLIIGAVLGGLVTVQIYFRRIKLFFMKILGKKKKDDRDKKANN